VGHNPSRRSHRLRELLLDSLPAADVAETDPDEWSEAGDDEEELQDLVVDGAGKAAEEDVAQNDDRRQDDGDVEDVGVGDDAAEDAEVWMSSRHCIHGDAGAEDRS